MANKCKFEDTSGALFDDILRSKKAEPAPRRSPRKLNPHPVQAALEAKKEAEDPFAFPAASPPPPSSSRSLPTPPKVGL